MRAADPGSRDAKLEELLESGQRHYARGLQEGDLDDATRTWQRATSLCTERPVTSVPCLRAFHSLAIALMQVELDEGEDDGTGALTVVREAGAAAPRELRADALLKLAQGAVYRKDFVEAVDIASELLALQGDTPEVLQLMSEALRGAGHHAAALRMQKRRVELRPEDPSSWFGLARSVELSGSVQEVLAETPAALEKAQQLTLSWWLAEVRARGRQAMCKQPAVVRVTDWGRQELKDVVAWHETWHAAGQPPEEYGWGPPGEQLPLQPGGLMFEAALSPLSAVPSDWPPLRYRDRTVRRARLLDVTLNGDDGIIVDQFCRIILPADDYHLPLHQSLSSSYFGERSRAPFVQAAVSLVGGLATTFHHFLLLALPRLAVLHDLLVEWPGLKVLVPSSGYPESRLVPYAAPLLELLAVGTGRLVPYHVMERQFFGATYGMEQAVRYRVGELLVADWHGSAHGTAHQLDTHNVAARSALQRLQQLLAPSAAGAGEAKRSVVLIQRRRSRRFMDERRMRTGLRSALPRGWRLRAVHDDALPPLREFRRHLAAAALLVGAHGAALANLLYCRVPATLVEVVPPQPHAHYYAHLAAALGLGYSPLVVNNTAMYVAKYLPASVTTTLPEVVGAAIRAFVVPDLGPGGGEL